MRIYVRGEVKHLGFNILRSHNNLSPARIPVADPFLTRRKREAEVSSSLLFNEMKTYFSEQRHPVTETVNEYTGAREK